MEPETNNETIVQKVEEKSVLHTVTPLSKYLAMVLFVILPFAGGWIGYQYAPEKIIEVEKVVEVQIASVNETPQTENTQLYSESEKVVVEDELSIASVVRNCAIEQGYDFKYGATSTLIENYLAQVFPDVSKRLDEGYVLIEACQTDRELLLLFDYSNGEVWSSPEEENKVLFGVADLNLSGVNLYTSTIEEYYVYGIGIGPVCHFSAHEENKFFYVCITSNDGGRDVMWRVFDETTGQHIPVKESFVGRYSNQNDARETFDQVLYEYYPDWGLDNPIFNPNGA